ncbi:MAG TPA: (Fe-S)-binding protein [Saprospiraceae bacterium]|nr:(Fe-S)-binding protein [Saprospiraceae bacterium]
MSLQIIFFILLSFAAFSYAGRRFYKIYRLILLGKEEDLSDHAGKRWANMLRFALAQGKMFVRPVAGFFHLFIYLAFLFTQIELIEIIVDGITGSHRSFAPILGGLYTFLINFIEFLSCFAFFATVVFLFRRNIVKVLRFQKPELSGWPSLDANLILLGEILLITGIFLMNGADQALQMANHPSYHHTGSFYLSRFFVSGSFSSFSADWLMIIERMGWWLHYMVILGFICYLSYSKHLHIFLAFPNSYFSSLEPRGKLTNMAAIENEVRSMLGQEARHSGAKEDFGVKDIFDLSWRNLLQAYSCTECGRCTDVCPANQTGKKLSPRKIMMDIRDRMEEVGQNINEFQERNAQAVFESKDNKSLFDYISKEEIYACTSCNACVEACPILINPLEPILQMRRYDILVNSGGPSEWLPMFNSLENNQAVWSISEERTAWIQS